MARPRKVPAKEPPKKEPIDREEYAPEPEPAEVLEAEPQTSALASVLAELAGASGKFTVYRANKGQMLAYLFECPPESFSLDDLRDKYNGGTFRLFVSRNGVLFRNIAVSVEAPQKQHADAVPGSADQLAALVRELMDKQAQQFRDLLAPALRPQQQLDIPGLLTAAGSLFGNMRQAIIPPPSAPAPVVAPTPAASMESMIALLQRGIELGRAVTPGEGAAAAPSGGGGILGLVETLLRSPAVAAIVESAKQATVGGAAPAAHAPVQQVHQAPAKPAAPAQPSETEQMQQQLARLVAFAEKGSAPSLYAGLIFDMVPMGRLKVFLSQPDLIETMVRLDPRVATYRGWFEDLRDELLALLRDAGELPAGPFPDDHSGHAA